LDWAFRLVLRFFLRFVSFRLVSSHFFPRLPSRAGPQASMYVPLLRPATGMAKLILGASHRNTHSYPLTSPHLAGRMLPRSAMHLLPFPNHKYSFFFLWLSFPMEPGLSRHSTPLHVSWTPTHPLNIDIHFFRLSRHHSTPCIPDTHTPAQH
jgi:hypothetical protein